MLEKNVAKLCKAVAPLFCASIFSAFSACDGPYYRVIVEEVVPADECYYYEEETTFDPNLVDPYSEDTNWYIDKTGNIVWRH